MVRMNMQGKWANISFASAVRGVEIGEHSSAQFTPKNPMIAMAKDYSQIKECTEIFGASKKVHQMEKQIANWAEPGKFDKLLEAWKEGIKEINGAFAKYAGNESPMVQNLIAQKKSEFIDAMDLTIKAMSKSSQYEDKQKQAKNFQQMLKPFAEVLRDWTEDKLNGFIKNGSEVVLQQINALLENKNINQRDLSPSGYFDVSGCLIGGSAADEGWKRNLSGCYTLEDCFTLIHQNLMNLAARGSKQSNKLIQNEFFKLLQEIDKLIEDKIKGTFTDCALMNISIENNKLILDYNVPLRNHSASIKVECNYKTKKPTLEFKIFGDARLRWNKVAFANTIQLINIDDTKLLVPPTHFKGKDICTFKVEIDGENDASVILDSAYEACRISLDGLNENTIGELLRKSGVETNKEKNEFLFNYTNDPYLSKFDTSLGQNITLRDLIFCPANKIYIYDKRALKLYKNNIVTIEELSKIDNSMKLRYDIPLYETSHNIGISKKELEDKLNSHYKLKIKEIAPGIYKKHENNQLLMFEHFFKNNPDKIKEFKDRVMNLTSEEIQPIYKSGAKFEDICEIYDKEKKRFNIFYCCGLYIEKSDYAFDELKELETSKLDKIICNSAYDFCKNNNMKLQELAKFSEEKIQACTGFDTTYFLNKAKEDDVEKGILFDDIKNLKLEVINYIAQTFVKSENKDNIKDFLKFVQEKIEEYKEKNPGVEIDDKEIDEVKEIGSVLNGAMSSDETGSSKSLLQDTDGKIPNLKKINDSIKAPANNIPPKKEQKKGEEGKSKTKGGFSK